jgi:O-methyltransferase domain/Dimerisation domain
VTEVTGTGSYVPASAEVDAARPAMWDMITGYRVSQMVRVAAALSLAEHCARGPVTAAELAAAESFNADATARLLRACASVGLVASNGDGSFAGTALLMALHRDTPGSMRGFALSLSAPGHWQPWGRLLEAVRDGKAQWPEALGQTLFEYYATAPDEAAAFTDGLLGMTSVAGTEAAKVLDTSGVHSAVDVGGASGSLLHDLMAVNPSLRGVVFDLEHVGAAAVAAAAAKGLSDRVKVETGDFFEAVPAGADLYLLRYVLHDWDDARCVQILKNCRAAMRPGGRVVVLEMLLGEIGREPPVVPSQDLNMLVLGGARERTVQQFDQLFHAAGLRRAKVSPTRSPMGVIEAVAG